MNASYAAILSTVIIITVLFALMIVSRSRTQKRAFEEELKNSWGKLKPRLFSAEEIKRIRRFADSSYAEELGKDAFLIDDITANDVDLDAVFARLDAAVSSPGEEILYDWLLRPELKEDALSERIALQDFFTAHEKERHDILRVLHGIGRLKGDSFFGAVTSLREAARIGSGRYILLAAGTFLSIVFLFIFPIPALISLLLFLAADFKVHIDAREATGPCLRGFSAILRLLDAADDLEKILPDGMPGTDKAALRGILRTFAPFRRGAFLVMSGASVGDSPAEAVLAYLKLFFHPDLILFDRMLSKVQGHEAEAVSLLISLGTLDAAAATASARLAYTVTARPALSSPGEGTSPAPVRIKAMTHPLLNEAVPNSVALHGPLLLTGSNASGKSTFLKGLALTAILAQSCGFVTAASYSAPFLRVMSSMALKDNLEGGESYFVVEIRSMKRIVDAAGVTDPPLLCLVDEVLRGTNTTERIAASASILRALARPHVFAVAATHDIELTYLLDGTYRNMHFEESADDEDVHFTYLLKEGRAASGNALTLLERNGYPEDITRAARRMKDGFLETGEWER